MAENEKDENPSIVPDVNIKKPRPTSKVSKIDWQTKGSFDDKDIPKEKLQRSRGDQQKIDELKNILEKETERSKIFQAKYENLRKDLEKETVNRINSHGDKIILDFLIVYEDFTRARDAYEKEGENVDNLNSIIKKIKSILRNYEVELIETKGKKSDPNLHEVIQEIEDNDHEEGTIVEEIAKGYIIRGEVMKYSKVCVSKKIIKE
jgi:molecular chaperone GrpE